MKFDILTLFPELIKFYSNYSILKKAQKEKKIEIITYNFRDFTADKYRTVDDRPFGGGRGMILKIEPIFKTIASLKIPNSKFYSLIGKSNFQQSPKKTKIILFTPRGKKFTQKIAHQFSQLERLVLICGRYEGIDERVVKYIADEQISIGNYVLMGGELPALVVMEAVTRLLPGVIGKSEFLFKRISKTKGFIEHPQYTRPEIFEPLKTLTEIGFKLKRVKKNIKWRVPKILLSGNHQQIKKWREKHQKIII